MARPPHEQLLFVYGTLRRGFTRHEILMKLGARFVATGRVPGALYHLGPFPGAVGAVKGFVHGEVYRFDDPAGAFRVLDTVEGFHERAPETGLFRRRRVTATLGDDRKLETWIYWLNQEPLTMRRIESGDYARP